MGIKIMDEMEIFKRHFIKVNKEFYNTAVLDPETEVVNAVKLAEAFNLVNPIDLTVSQLTDGGDGSFKALVTCDLFSTKEQTFKKINIETEFDLYELASEEVFPTLEDLSSVSTSGVYKVQDGLDVKLVVAYLVNETPEGVLQEALKFTTTPPVIDDLINTVGFTDQCFSLVGGLKFNKITVGV